MLNSVKSSYGHARQCSGANSHTPLRHLSQKAPARFVASFGTTYDDLHIISSHPEAIKRRHEAEMRQWERDEERRKEKEQEAKGLSWFEGECPDNFFLLHSKAEFEQCVIDAQTAGKLVVANFFTSECYVCKTLYPKLKKIAAENNDVIFVKLNGSNETLRPFFEEWGITKVPFFNLIRERRVVSAFTASLLPEKLAQLRGEINLHKRAPALVAA